MCVCVGGGGGGGRRGEKGEMYWGSYQYVQCCRIVDMLMSVAVLLHSCVACHSHLLS